MIKVGIDFADATMEFLDEHQGWGVFPDPGHELANLAVPFGIVPTKERPSVP